MANTKTYPGEFSYANKGQRYIATGEFRAPKRGEFYLSGAIVQAYRAPNDLTSAYHIAKPVLMKKCVCCDGTGEVVAGS